MRIASRVIPPSTRISSRGRPVSATTASTTSRVWKAVDSRAARAMWALFTYRVSPTSAPRVRPPIRGEQPRERGHEVGAAVVVDGRGERLDILRPLDDPEVVAQPL